MSTARTAPGTEPRDSVTLRPPRVLIYHGASAGRPIKPGAIRHLRRRKRLREPSTPAVVVYRVAAGSHQQTGIVVEVSVEDYRSGRIRRHEATDPERERKLVNFTETTGVEQVPVMLTHSSRPSLRQLLSSVTVRRSDVDLWTREDQVHSVWIAEEPDLVDQVQDELNTIPALYIADGHHRMAAAEAYSARREPGGLSDFALGALFPSDELRVLGYPRSVPRPPTRSTEEILSALSASAEDLERRVPDERTGTASIFLDGAWYRVRLPVLPDGTRSPLDVVALDEVLVPSVFGRPPTTSIPESFGPSAIARWCTEHDAIGFLAKPPSVDQVMALADAGQIMPAKSTRFDPKAVAGLFVRKLT